MASGASFDELLVGDGGLGLRTHIIGHEVRPSPKRHVVYVIEVNRGGGNIEFVRRRYSAFTTLLADVRAR